MEKTKDINNKPEDHECRYSRSMNQPYPRRCVICGKPKGSDSLIISK